MSLQLFCSHPTSLLFFLSYYFNTVFSASPNRPYSLHQSPSLVLLLLLMLFLPIPFESCCLSAQVGIPAQAYHRSGFWPQGALLGTTLNSFCPFLPFPPRTGSYLPCGAGRERAVRGGEGGGSGGQGKRRGGGKQLL